MTDTLIPTDPVAEIAPHPHNDREKMGGFSTWLFAVAAIGLVFAGLYPFSTMAGLFPGANLLGMVSVAMLACLVVGFTYSLIGAAVRKSGAGYILASRVLSPGVGLGSSLILVFFCIQFIGAVLAQAAQTTLPVFLRSIAMGVGNPGFILNAEQVSSSQGIAIIGSVFVVLAFVLAILPPRMNRFILLGGGILSLLSWVGVIFMLLFPYLPFETAWDNFMGMGGYAAQMNAATNAGMQSAGGLQPVVIGGLVFGLLIFFGCQAPAHLAGEVKTPQRTLSRAIIGGVLVTWLIMVVTTLAVQRVIPVDWISAQSFLALQGTNASPWIPLYALLVQPNPWFAALLGIAWLFSLLVMTQAFFMFTSRTILAWTMDGLLPQEIGYIHPQLRSPMIALLMMAIAAEVSVWGAARSGIEFSFAFFLFTASFAQLLPVVALSLAPWRKKEWYAQQVSLVNLRIGSLPLVTLTGVFSTLYLLGVVAYGLSQPQFSRPATGAVILSGILFFVGLGYFAIRRRSMPLAKDNFSQFPE